MFVRSSKYNELKNRYDALRLMYDKIDKHNDKLIADWNNLVRWIKKVGGIDKLKSLVANESNITFSQSEIESLIRLCHPDKHGGSPASTRITTKLLQIRNKR